MAVASCFSLTSLLSFERSLRHSSLSAIFFSLNECTSLRTFTQWLQLDSIDTDCVVASTSFGRSYSVPLLSSYLAASISVSRSSDVLTPCDLTDNCAVYMVTSCTGTIVFDSSSILAAMLSFWNVSELCVSDAFWPKLLTVVMGISCTVTDYSWARIAMPSAEKSHGSKSTLLPSSDDS